MKIVGWLLGLFVLLILGALAAGVRFHPKAIFENMSSKSSAFRRVELVSGTAFEGELLSETDGNVEMKVYGGKVSFTKDEIQKIETISADSQDILQKNRESFLTYRAKDALWRLAAKRKTKTSPSISRSSSSSSSSSSTSSSSTASVIQTGKHALELTSKTRKQIADNYKSVAN